MESKPIDMFIIKAIVTVVTFAGTVFGVVEGLKKIKETGSKYKITKVDDDEQNFV